MTERRAIGFRFKLRTLLLLMLGIAIGFSLNLQVVRLLWEPANEQRMVSLPKYAIEPPDVLHIKLKFGKTDPSANIDRKFQVGPDGNVNLGKIGPVYVAGMTMDEAVNAICAAVPKSDAVSEIVVDVWSFNSKKYYVVVAHPQQADQVYAMPITGNETVLDAIAQIGGLPRFANPEVSLARPPQMGSSNAKVLPVDWKGIVTRAETTSNYQLFPGDRVIIRQSSSPAQ